MVGYGAESLLPKQSALARLTHPTCLCILTNFLVITCAELVEVKTCRPQPWSGLGLGSLPSFEWDDVMSSLPFLVFTGVVQHATPIRLITRRHSLSLRLRSAQVPASSTRCSVKPPCDGFTPFLEENNGLTLFRVSTVSDLDTVYFDRLSTSFHRGDDVRVVHARVPQPAPVPFGSSLSALLRQAQHIALACSGCDVLSEVEVTMVATVHLCSSYRSARSLPP